MSRAGGTRRARGDERPTRQGRDGESGKDVTGGGGSRISRHRGGCRGWISSCAADLDTADDTQRNRAEDEDEAEEVHGADPLRFTCGSGFMALRRL